jgi:hypothetical protein
MTSELRGKSIVILAADGVEQVELEQPGQAVQAAGAVTELLSVVDQEVVTDQNITSSRWPDGGRLGSRLELKGALTVRSIKIFRSNEPWCHGSSLPFRIRSIAWADSSDFTTNPAAGLWAISSV